MTTRNKMPYATPLKTSYVQRLLILKTNEKIRSQHAAFKHETKTHINSWAQVVRGRDKVPPTL